MPWSSWEVIGERNLFKNQNTAGNFKSSFFFFEKSNHQRISDHLIFGGTIGESHLYSLVTLVTNGRGKKSIRKLPYQESHFRALGSQSVNGL